MITNLSLSNFKCFKHVDFPVSKINVFTGVNGMGKSTAIQALTLLRQTYDAGSLKKGLLLNGEIVTIGSGVDLLSFYSPDDEEIEIKIAMDGSEISFVYSYDDSDYLQLKEKLSDANYEIMAASNICNNDFCYIAAERIGPRQIYDFPKYAVNVQHRLGWNGENAVAYLLEQGENKLESAFVLLPTESHSLEKQTNAWLKEISPYSEISIQDYKEAHKVGLSYRTPGKHGYRNSNAINVGFGVSYVLPVIIALLKAKRGDLVVLENPEAHLHPEGQRKIGELISLAAAGGVQVFVETHSDHILNGLRIAVKNSIVDSDDVVLNFLGIAEKIEYTEDGSKVVSYEHQNTSPKIMKNGALDIWPAGFFDAWDNEIEDLY